MSSKRRFSILKLLISIICIIFIAASLAINIFFSGHKTPHIMGKYLYVVDQNSVGEGVTPGALLIAAETGDTELKIGDIVLCKNEASGSAYNVRGICDIVQSEEGIKKYAIGIATTPITDQNGDRVTVTKDKIAAVCTGNPQSLEAGRFISFTASIKGIIFELILPCVILVIFLIAKIASSSNDEDDDDEEYNFYEYDDEPDFDGGVPSHEKQNGPLFEPSQEIQPSNEFERKKMSIAENFAPKEVDKNSSYQKEKERTMQFKAQRGMTGTYDMSGVRGGGRPQNTSTAESNFAARNISGQSSTAPTADALREKMLRETAEAERGGAYNTKTYSSGDMTGVYSKPQYTGQGGQGTAPANNAATQTPAGNSATQSIPKQKPQQPKRRVSPISHEKKSSSPSIDDIIAHSANEAKKKNASNMSVEDLIKFLDDEKKKL